MEQAADALLIHRFGPEDVALMAVLNRCFGEVFDEPQTYCKAPPSAAYLQRLLGSDCFIALAALKGAEIVGALYTRLGTREDVLHFDIAVGKP